jgi:protein involved in polysaccharide export with SLBB domain
VKGPVEATAWALTRLSSALGTSPTDYASFRDIRIRAAGGQIRTYDLFKARRLGDLSQDPYLRPGDTIILSRAPRQVTLEGAVERPGHYQLLPVEELQELVENYGSGFTTAADRSRLELARLVNSVHASGDKLNLSPEDYAQNYPLEDSDVITVPAITNLRPVLFVEGAIGTSAAASPTAASRQVVAFNQGDDYAALIRRNSGWFTAVSDTRNAYIIRGDRQIPLNLNPVLYDANYRVELLVESNDTLVIPFRQYFVTVAGAVYAPGRYPYIPDRTWDYYIALAGGFIPEKNASEAVTIRDISGQPLKKTDYISPEAIITAKSNNFLYYFGIYAPIIATTLSLISASLALYNTLSR